MTSTSSVEKTMAVYKSGWRHKRGYILLTSSDPSFKRSCSEFGLPDEGPSFEVYVSKSIGEKKKQALPLCLAGGFDPLIDQA